MAEWSLKYADSRGEIHQKVAEADSEGELRDRLTSQGFLVYSIRPRSEMSGIAEGFKSKSRKLNVEKFLIFNQQFVTLIRAGLPILKSLDLLADRLTDPKLSKYINGVRDEVRNGALLSDAFAPPGCVPADLRHQRAGRRTQRLADRSAGALHRLSETLAVSAQKTAGLADVSGRADPAGHLADGVPGHLRGPELRRALQEHGRAAPRADPDPDRHRDHRAKLRAVRVRRAAGRGIVAFRYWSRTPSGGEAVDRMLLRIPVLGEVWLKYQVAQFSRILGTLLVGGIPLLQALDTGAESLGTQVLKKVLQKAVKLVREGQSLSAILARNQDVSPACRWI